jgi:hypothetical protein
MRQKNAPLDKTGTDHNPLTNTILLGGKGIRGGLVIGASDFQSPDESLSPAHLALDPDLLKIMGRPFDYAAFRPRSELPSDFEATDYLSTASVVNTIYDLFAVDEAHHWLQMKNGPIAPVLRPLLV